MVEDDGQVLEALQLSLEASGYHVAAGGTIAEALALCHQHPYPPQAIVADLRLHQGESGTEAITRLRAEFGATIPGILLTGDTAPDRLNEAKSSGLHLLHKPVAPDAVIEAIEQALTEGQRPHR